MCFKKGSFFPTNPPQMVFVSLYFHMPPFPPLHTSSSDPVFWKTNFTLLSCIVNEFQRRKKVLFRSLLAVWESLGFRAHFSAAVFLSHSQTTLWNFLLSSGHHSSADFHTLWSYRLTATNNSQLFRAFQMKALTGKCYRSEKRFLRGSLWLHLIELPTFLSALLVATLLYSWIKGKTSLFRNFTNIFFGSFAA